MKSRLPAWEPHRRLRYARLAEAHLRMAVQAAAKAGTPQTLKRLRAVLKSAQGAVRNRERFAYQHQEEQS